MDDTGLPQRYVATIAASAAAAAAIARIPRLAGSGVLVIAGDAELDRCRVRYRIDFL